MQSSANQVTGFSSRPRVKQIWELSVLSSVNCKMGLLILELQQSAEEYGGVV